MIWKSLFSRFLSTKTIKGQKSSSLSNAYELVVEYEAIRTNTPELPYRPISELPADKIALKAALFEVFCENLFGTKDETFAPFSAAYQQLAYFVEDDLAAALNENSGAEKHKAMKQQHSPEEFSSRAELSIKIGFIIMDANSLLKEWNALASSLL